MRLQHLTIQLAHWPGRLEEGWPVLALSTSSNESWHILSRPPVEGQPAQVTLSHGSLQMAVPVFPYLVERSPARLPGYSLELATTLLAQLPGKAEELLVLSGDEIEVVEDATGSLRLRFWLGLAAREGEVV